MNLLAVVGSHRKGKATDTLVDKAIGGEMRRKRHSFIRCAVFSLVVVLSACSNGINFDSDDILYVTSILKSEIVLMDRETGEVLQRLGAGEGVKGPDDVAVAPDGTLYWTNYSSGEACRRADNVTTCQSVGAFINPITISDDGRVFVATALPIFSDALYELDPDLVRAPERIFRNPGMLNGMDWGPDGFLYAPSWTVANILRIDVDSCDESEWCENETIVNGTIAMPAAVKFDSQGDLYALDSLSGQVLQVDATTGSVTVIATLPAGLDNLAFDSEDRLFVSNIATGIVVEILSDGSTRTVSGLGPP
jgi:sugar lactone lactonase YvrE